MLLAHGLKGWVHFENVNSRPKIPRYLFLVTAGTCLAPAALKELGDVGDQDEEQWTWWWLVGL